MGSLFFLVSLLLLLTVCVDAFTISLSNLKPGLCIGVQSNANIAANPSAPVLYGCNLGQTLNTGSGMTARLTFSTTGFPNTGSGAECVPQLVSSSAGTAPTITKYATTTTTLSFAINSGAVTAGSVHLYEILNTNCVGLDTAEYRFYIQFLGTPSITSITATTTAYNQYCSVTNSGSVYTVSSCYKNGGPTITVNGDNFDGNLLVEGSFDEEFNEYACEIAAVKGTITKPTWNTATGSINSASSVVLSIAEVEHGTTATSGSLIPYVPGKSCSLKTNQGDTNDSGATFSIDWFTATTTFTQLTSSVCTTSGNNIIDCAPFGSNGAQAITFIGTNFGPNDAPLTLTGTNDICTTNTLTRVPGFDQATCILKASTGGAVTAPSLLAIGVTSSSGISSPTFSYGSTVVTNITCAACLCYGACDYNGNGVTDSLCGCSSSESGLSIGTITLGGRNFLASGSYDACNGNYQSTDGLTATCTAVSGSTNTTRPIAATAGLLAYKTNHFNAVPLIQTVTYKSSSGGTNLFDLTVTLMAQKSGRAFVRLVASSYTATEAAVKDGSGGGFKCSTGPVSVVAAVQASVSLTDCPTIAGDKVVVYIDQAAVDSTESGYFGSVASSSNAVTLPAVITSITSSSCAGECTVSGNPYLCGCPTSTAGFNLTVWGSWSTNPTDASLCGSNPLYFGTENGKQFYSCILGSAGSVGSFRQSSNNGAGNRIYFITNSFNSIPTFATPVFTSGTNYDITIRFTAAITGRYTIAIVSNTGHTNFNATSGYHMDYGLNGGILCKSSAITANSMTGGAEKTVVLSCPETIQGGVVKVFIDGDISSYSGAAVTGPVETSTTTIALPPVVTSITVSGSSCTQCSVASGKSTTNICGCALAGGATITVHGKNLNGQTENSVCSVNTVSSSDTSFSCTLASSLVGSYKQVTFTTTSYGDVRAYYISNVVSTFAMDNAPSSAAVLDYKTFFSVSFTAPQAGKAYAVAFASSGNDFAANATQVKSVTHIPSGVQVCNSAQSGSAISAGATNIYSFTCGDGTSSGAFAMTNGWTARIFVYVEGESEAATDYYGSVSVVQTASICPSDCATCSRSDLGYCLSCHSSPAGVHLETYNSLKYCCLAECATCGPRSNSGTSLTANSCASCNTTKKDHLSHDGQTLTYCCHGSCSTCSGNSLSQCTTCGGYNSGLFYNGMCKNGTYEIHGDPHFHGYLDQDYTVTGRPSAVYSIITDPWLQYNTRFIWYGDVYHGFDPTTNKPYDANVTYIGEIGMKFNWGDREDRVYINVDGFAVFLNGRQITDTASATKFGDGCSIVRSAASGKKFIDVETKKFRVRFFLAGSRKHPFINQRVELLDWMGIASHGLLGQTWKHEQVKGINRNAIWEGHQGGVDFQFRTAEFLEGHLWDYEIKENNVFGDDFTYNQYTFKHGK